MFPDITKLTDKIKFQSYYFHSDKVSINIGKSFFNSHNFIDGWTNSFYLFTNSNHHFWKTEQKHYNIVIDIKMLPNGIFMENLKAWKRMNLGRKTRPTALINSITHQMVLLWIEKKASWSNSSQDTTKLLFQKLMCLSLSRFLGVMVDNAKWKVMWIYLRPS